MKIDNKVLSLILYIFISNTYIIRADDSNNILYSIYNQEKAENSFYSQPYNNPAITQFKQNYSLSQISLSYNNKRDNETINPQLGDGYDYFKFNADSYLKKKNSVVWGNAQYINGTTHNIKFNETTDYDKVYPYILADNIGGDMNDEIYSFSGGYSSYYGKLSWGAYLHYTAGLHYRAIDPRPNNVTGDITGLLGIGANISNKYILGTSVTLNKYKQTNNVAFYSELGQAKLYHLTGLNNDYTRFAGDGYSTYYKGYKYGIQVDLYSKKSDGLVISLNWEHYDCDNILTALNNLPMAKISQNRYNTEFIYSFKTSNNNKMGLNLLNSISLRNGNENIFGDAASSIYPQIGSLKLYKNSIYNSTLKAYYQYDNNNICWSIEPKISYLQNSESYLNPHSSKEFKNITFSTGGKISILKKKITGKIGLDIGYYKPLNGKLNLNKETKDNLLLNPVIESEFNYLNSSHIYTQMNGELNYKISNKYAIRASIDWNYSKYKYETNRNYINTSISFIL